MQAHSQSPSGLGRRALPGGVGVLLRRPLPLRALPPAASALGADGPRKRYARRPCQVAELRGHPLYRVATTEVLADTRNSKWKAADHRCGDLPAGPPASLYRPPPSPSLCIPCLAASRRLLHTHA